VSLIKKKVRVLIGLISCLILLISGLSWLITGFPNTYIPVLFTVGGFIGFIGGVLELKKLIVPELKITVSWNYTSNTSYP
jgi:hypothetical protein